MQAVDFFLFCRAFYSRRNELLHMLHELALTLEYISFSISSSVISMSWSLKVLIVKNFPEKVKRSRVVRVQIPKTGVYASIVK